MTIPPSYTRILLFCTCLATLPFTASGRDLDDIRADGVLRHLGIPYANFVTGGGDGLSVDLVKGFAERIGVRYEYVETDWKHVFGDLTGRHARRNGGNAELLESTPTRVDIVANGMTILPWRQQLVAFSEPTFPSGVWLVARADSSLLPITPADGLDADIHQVRALLPQRTVLALVNTWLDPDMYDMAGTGADMKLLPPNRA